MNVVELQRALRQLRLGGMAAVLETRLHQAQAGVDERLPAHCVDREVQRPGHASIITDRQSVYLSGRADGGPPVRCRRLVGGRFNDLSHHVRRHVLTPPGK